MLESEQDPQQGETATEKCPWWEERRYSHFLAAGRNLLIALFPAIYLFHFITPNPAKTLPIGNDFLWLYYAPKIYLLGALGAGHFPLWSPADGAGFPFYSNPYCQAFYPLNLILLLFYKMNGGYSPYDHQVFTVAGVCIFALGLYRWLRGLGYPARNALFASMVLGICFRTTELLRFPNAIHTAAWIPWMLLGMTKCTRPATRISGGLLLSGSTIMYLTGGYPYYNYYGIFLFGPYALALVVPQIRKVFMPDETDAAKPVQALGALTVFVGTPILLCAPYVLKMRQVLAQTTDRAGGNWSYATEYQFNLKDTVGSLVFPPGSCTEGWFYFGIIGLILIALLAVSAGGQSEQRRRNGMFVLLILGWCTFVLNITYGARSHLFALLWQSLPGFSNLRVWGRMDIILVPLLALALARAHAFFETLVLKPGSRERRADRPMRFALVSLIVIYAAIVGVQFLYRQLKWFDRYWLAYFAHPAGLQDWFILSGLVSFAVLLVSLVWFGNRPLRTREGAWALTLLFVLVSTVDMRPVGAFQWAMGDRVHTRRAVLNVPALAMASLAVPRQNNMGLVPPKFGVGTSDNWNFDRYGALRRAVYSNGNRPKVLDPEVRPWLDKLLGVDGGERLFVTDSMRQASVRGFVEEAMRVKSEGAAQLAVKSYDGDVLDVDVSAKRALCLSFIDNWDPDWQAEVNGARVPIELLFGTFKSVRIPKGQSHVRFAYRPRMFSWTIPPPGVAK